MKNEFATSIELKPVDREELASVSGGLVSQIGGLFTKATIFHPGDQVAIYVDGIYRGQGFRV